MKNKTLTISATIGIGLLVLLGAYVLTASAEETENNPLSSIVQKIAERFNLNEEEVEEVFIEEREERRAEHQASFEERLDEAIEEGKITEEQKSAILEKKAEMEEKREELKDLSREERRETMRELHEEMEQWTEDNGIDLKDFFECGLGGRGKGFPGREFDW